eukprot:g6302.t1
MRSAALGRRVRKQIPSECVDKEPKQRIGGDTIESAVQPSNAKCMNDQNSVSDWIGKRICKRFAGHGVFEGRINEKWFPKGKVGNRKFVQWRIEYEDGDVEDLSTDEVKRGLALWNSRREKEKEKRINKKIDFVSKKQANLVVKKQKCSANDESTNKNESYG